MRMLCTAVLCLLASPFLASQAAAFETSRITIVHDGVERRSILDMPPEARKAPVLIGLHGGLARASSIRRRAGLTLASRGWVVLWPSALGDWNDGRVDWTGDPYDDADDIGFLRKLVGGLVADGVADPERVFVAGPSIGGIMALRLLCDAPDLIAGAAIAIASLPSGGPLGESCADGPPRPVLYIHGDDDPLIPESGGRIGGWNPLIRDRGWVRPVAETLDVLARRNRCDGYNESRLDDIAPDDGSTVLRRDYRDCEAPLIHYVVEGGGHTWPGGRPSRLGARIVGATNHDFSATRALEAFFETLAERMTENPAE